MINGIINIYKEKGFTSHDVVAKLRGALKQKKIGHTGTLDPDATGVLPVCLGNATKLCDMFTDKTKTYVCTMLLGIETDTEDIGGKIIKERDIKDFNFTKDLVKEKIMSFVGEYNQIPPMYSAIKLNGKKLYDLARQGMVVERKPRSIVIFHVNITEISLPQVTFEVTCSKGTYIRSLCRDIGSSLGCGACMKELVRTKSGQFTIENSLKLSEVEKYIKEGTISDYIISTEDALKIFGSIYTFGQGDKLLQNGNAIPEEYIKIVEQGKDEKNLLFKTYDSNNNFIGLYRKEENRFVNEKMFL